MVSSTRRQVIKSGVAANAALSLGALSERVHGAAAATATYQPQQRSITISMVPLLTHEQTSILSYLNKAFDEGGVLYDKEIYAFMPSTTTCFAGDTLNVTLVNPADDPHTFSVLELAKSIKVDGAATGSIALENLAAGIYTVSCEEPEHMPYMWGQIVVLAPPA